MSTWLVCVAHGSRDPRWRAPIEALVAQVHAHCDGVVRLAYMDHARPSLADVVREAQLAGVTRLRVWPLFMSGGGHVEHDLPALVEGARAGAPNMALELLAPLGTHPRFVKLVCELAEEIVAS